MLAVLGTMMFFARGDTGKGQAVVQPARSSVFLNDPALSQSVWLIAMVSRTRLLPREEIYSSRKTWHSCRSPLEVDWYSACADSSVKPGHRPHAVLQLAGFLLVSIVGNLASILAPYRIAAGSLKPTKHLPKHRR
jgi:hypothetical protein